MKNPSPGKLRVIKIVDPLLCVRCGSAYIADVVMSDGKRQKMFYCARLDCDNWVSPNSASTEPEELDPAA